jgi:CDP-glucose 4,6-dehydratase
MVYRNNEWLYGYREDDPLGGHDPNSSSKAAAELAIASWRASLCGSQPHQSPHLLIAKCPGRQCDRWRRLGGRPDRARCDAGSGAGRADRRTQSGGHPPWQRVLEPLDGYLLLAERLSADPSLASAFNFGPQLEAHRSVRELVVEALLHWPGSWVDQSDPGAPHEASLLNLVIDKVTAV